jgi:chitinase
MVLNSARFISCIGIFALVFQGCAPHSSPKNAASMSVPQTPKHVNTVHLPNDSKQELAQPDGTHVQKPGGMAAVKPTGKAAATAHVKSQSNVSKARGIARKKQKKIVVYFPSWVSHDRLETGLQSVSTSVNVINLAFVSPAAIYKGDGDLSRTDLGFSGEDLHSQLQALRMKNPTIKILLSIGGWGASWDEIHETDIALIVKDFDLDGVDIDFEPSDTHCFTNGPNSRSCSSDSKYIEIVKRFRKVLPRPSYISAAVWPTGAFGVGDFSDSKPSGRFTGQLLNVLPQVGNKLDLINIMAYNATSRLNSLEALHAYQAVYKGAVTVGVSVPPEESGDHILTESELSLVLENIVETDAAGIMVWTSHRLTLGSSHLIDLPTVIRMACREFKLNNPSQTCAK